MDWRSFYRKKTNYHPYFRVLWRFVVNKDIKISKHSQK